MHWEQQTVVGPRPKSPQVPASLIEALEQVITDAGDDAKLDYVRLRKRLTGAENYAKFDNLVQIEGLAARDIATELVRAAIFLYAKKGIEARFEAKLTWVGGDGKRSEKSITFHIADGETGEDDDDDDEDDKVSPAEWSLVKLAKEDPQAFALIFTLRETRKMSRLLAGMLEREAGRVDRLTSVATSSVKDIGTATRQVLAGAAEVHQIGAGLVSSGLALQREHAGGEIEKEKARLSHETLNSTIGAVMTAGSMWLATKGIVVPPALLNKFGAGKGPSPSAPPSSGAPSSSGPAPSSSTGKVYSAATVEAARDLLRLVDDEVLGIMGARGFSPPLVGMFDTKRKRVEQLDSSDVGDLLVAIENGGTPDAMTSVLTGLMYRVDVVMAFGTFITAMQGDG